MQFPATTLAALLLCSTFLLGQELPAKIKPLLVKNCVGCHNAGFRSGSFELRSLLATSSLAKNADVWEKVVDKLRSGEMPPPKSSSISAPERALLIEEIDASLAGLDGGPASNRPVALRRLNRTEYNHAVRDLLGVDFRPAADFPPDDTGYGFDNIGEVLSVSPSLMSKYTKAAERIARVAVYGQPLIAPSLQSLQPWYVDFGTSQEVLSDYDESGLSLPSALHVTHFFPVDAEYEIAGLLRGTRPSGSEDLPIAFWIDGKQVQVLDYSVPPGGEVSGQRRQFRIRVPVGEHWLAASVLRFYEGLPAVYGGPNPSRKPLPAPIRRTTATNAPTNAEAPSTPGRSRQPTNAFFISNLDINGPFHQTLGPSPESKRKIFVCEAESEQPSAPCQERILRALARRAYRRPPQPAELAGLRALVKLAESEGDTFQEGLVLAIQKLLISPSFLFRIEEPPKSRVAPLTNHELASRLSFFLWSTSPDEELSQLADRAKLSDDAVLRAQVTRMLRDPRIREGLVENFAGQWLQFRALESHEPDRKQFQQFTEYTRMSFRQETSLFFASLIQEDKSILDLLSARYSFLNERIANFYGIPGVKGHEFRRVDLSHIARAGVLTHGSVLTVSSYANRTSPVLRGKWVLENLFNTLPPPAPPDVPNLDESAIGSKGSLREQMEKHRSNAVCASCHSRMDPLGFGLENFDAIGQWREKDGNFPVDASGELPGGRRFYGPVELATLLREDQEAFSAALICKLMTYALGRGLDRRDRREARAIASAILPGGARFSDLIWRIVSSPTFRMKTRTLQSQKENHP